MIDDVDLQTAYKWFTHLDGTQINNPEIGKKMLEIKVALGHGAFELVEELWSDLRTNIDDPTQQGEAGLLIALLTLDIKDSDIQKYFVARDFLEKAANYYYEESAASDDRHFHYLAVFAWLRGYISWQLWRYQRLKHTDLLYPLKGINQYRVDAIRSWQFCIRALADLSYTFLVPKPGYYQEIRWRVTESLFETRRRDKYLAISKVEHWYPPFTPTAQKTQQPRPSKPATATWPTTYPPGRPKPRQPIVNRRIPVIERIPAGGLQAIKLDELEFTEVDQLIINGDKYFIQNLLDQGEVNLLRNMNYLIAHIHGDSMNQINIQDGDYVLVQLQETAEHMDIVLATGLTEIDEIGRAALKRYIVRGSTIELQPESNNPRHENIPITKGDPLKILGIAIAVLKPLEEENENPEST